MSTLVSVTPVHDGKDETVYVQEAEIFLRRAGWIRASEASTAGVRRLLDECRSKNARTTG